jgi:S-adenosylmethionine:tRNA ribosyltransferase-isomerase
MEMLDVQLFQYDLPEEKIALYPLKERDESKLLVYRNGSIGHSQFFHLTDHLPSGAFLFFNDTKVIPARLHFKKSTGAHIEIFLLHPVTPSIILSETMSTTQACTWSCTIGNLKRWSEAAPLILETPRFALTAILKDRERGIVEFNWTSGYSFAEVISALGVTPLPPYIRRDPVSDDRRTYQTIYSHHEGAVAAPTAGLHFTDRVFDSLSVKNIGHDFLTLHVSAGTFQPIKTRNAHEHVMHEEQIVVTKKNIENLVNRERFIVAVGTTSLRTLESIYWYGVRLMNGDPVFKISQDDPYSTSDTPPVFDALNAVLAYMDRIGTDTLIGETSIFIKPGYKFRICKGLITNFHQPGSTLILLVAAFIGDNWRKVYEEALAKNYRFLSYGDSSLLLP